MTVYILANDVIRVYKFSVYHIDYQGVSSKDQIGLWQTPCELDKCDHLDCVLKGAEWTLTSASLRLKDKEKAKKAIIDINEFVGSGTINGYPARQVHVALPFVCTEMFEMILYLLLAASFLVMVPLAKPVFYYVAAIEVIVWIVRKEYYFKGGGLNPIHVRYW